jgi:hypothetical protein
MSPLQMHRDITDKAVNFDLYIGWLDKQVSVDQLLSWCAIIVMGYIAYWMARYTIKHF